MTFKSILKSIIITILGLEARIVLKKYKPKIIAITGSVGKTSTKDAIYTAISSKYFVRKTEKSFNGEIGIPLTILGCPNAWTDVRLWFENILHGIDLIIFKHKYPEWLVLEVGADKPGDIQKVSKWLKTDVVVITRIGEVPVHLEFYPTRDDLVKEKKSLMYSLKPQGILVLNNDDKDVSGFKKDSKNKTIMFGLDGGADIVASHVQTLYEKETGDKVPRGFTFKINHQGNSVPVSLYNVLGMQHLYPVIAASATGIAIGMNLVETGQSLLNHVPPRGRMNLLAGTRNSHIIDDTYNASPVAMQEALEAFKQIEVKGKKIAVLGDMLELGMFSADEHKKVGESVAHNADVLVTVGMRAKRIAEGATQRKMSEENIQSFDDATSAAEYVNCVIKEGDLILVKGSQGMRMERIVEKIMAQPERKEDLLVRQDEEWLKRK